MPNFVFIAYSSTIPPGASYLPRFSPLYHDRSYHPGEPQLCESGQKKNLLESLEKKGNRRSNGKKTDVDKNSPEQDKKQVRMRINQSEKSEKEGWVEDGFFF